MKIKQDEETLRVSLNRLERMNDLVGELVILQSLVESSLSKVGEFKTARSLGKLCKDIQDLSMSLRMVPIAPTFQKLSHTVKEQSLSSGKTIDLRLIGEDTEIDKTIVENLEKPLTRIIKNSISNGIESSAERTSCGKNEVGIVEVMAFHEGNFLVIQITDDGKGNPIDESSDMDFVKTSIETLGGEFKVQTKAGNGSCFRLMLPLTLAIIEGMLIQSDQNTFVIPKAQIQEVIRLEKDLIKKVTGRIPYLRLRDDVIPLFTLEQDLGASNPTESQIALVVKHHDYQFAVGITDVIRLQQVVIKPPSEENNITGVMGTTILGDGKPSFILDLLCIYMKKVRKETALEYKKVS